MEVDAEVVLGYENGQASERHTPDLETGVYRIVQEALTNAGKHGTAPRATVSVIEQDEQVHVIVRDDGRGFDQTAVTAGFGLAGMRERVELLGGQLELSSVIGEGTTVTATLPVTRRPPSATPAMAPSAASSA
jgi:signal transduction histidine kinase